MDTLLASQPPYLSETVERIARQFEPLRIIPNDGWPIPAHP